jgi:hypothetical protein
LRVITISWNVIMVGEILAWGVSRLCRLDISREEKKTQEKRERRVTVRTGCDRNREGTPAQREGTPKSRQQKGLGGKVDPAMGSVAEGLLGGGAATAEMVGLLTILDDLALVVGDGDFTHNFERTVLHAFHIHIGHGSLL